MRNGCLVDGLRMLMNGSDVTDVQRTGLRSCAAGEAKAAVPDSLKRYIINYGVPTC